MREGKLGGLKPPIKTSFDDENEKLFDFFCAIQHDVEKNYIPDREKAIVNLNV